jgi:hypothetical protein
MTTFAKPMRDRFAAMVKGHDDTLKLHKQQIVLLQSQVAATSALVPGSWETIQLTGGWSNVSGAIPAQARLLTSTTLQIVANIQGGTTTDNTVIGTLTAGFYNTVHSHTFGITAVSGAAAVSSAVTQGSLQNTAGTLDVGSGTNIPATDHTFSLSGSDFAHGSVKMGPSSGNQISNNAGGTPFTLASGTLNSGQSTNINYNRPCATLGTDGTIRILNVQTAVQHISFHEAGLPLFTA